MPNDFIGYNFRSPFSLSFARFSSHAPTKVTNKYVPFGICLLMFIPKGEKTMQPLMASLGPFQGSLIFNFQVGGACKYLWIECPFYSLV
jgi:uncharacterized circularly permuted ATP-grasp superfamily protein